MRQLRLFELPDDIIFEIFKHMKKNCESGRPAAEEIQYADLFSFALSCERICYLLRDWNANLYKRLVQYLVAESSRTHIDFEEKYNRLKYASANLKEAYWNSLSHDIKNADSMEVKIEYAPESSHPEHMGVLNTVMGILQEKQNLKSLTILSPGYSLEGLGTLKSLQTLHLNIRMDIDDLVEICRQNKNLRLLSYMNTATRGKRLAAIAPHCHQLKMLIFKMRPDCDASEYTPLATIPRLQCLRIEGVHEKGTLHPLLDALASKQRKVLNTLRIDDVLVDENETQAIAQIETLTGVECGFDDPQSIGLLAQLPNLKDLEILSRHDLKAICEQVVSILKESKTEKKIKLENSYVVYKPSGELVLKMRKSANASDYSPLSTLPGLSSLRIYGSPQTGSLQGLLAALASSQAQTLKELYLSEEEIQPGEAKELARLRSLRVLKCRFADPGDIQLLSQLTNLIELDLGANAMLSKTLPGILTAMNSCKKLAKIQIWCPVPGGTVDIKTSEILVEMLEGCQDEIYISVNDHEISFNRGKKLLSIEIDFFNRNNLAIEPLALLESVNHMKINGPRKAGSFRKFFATLATRESQDLQSLSVDGSSLDFSETTELAKITSLKSFRGSLSDGRGIQHLLHLDDFIVMDEDTDSRYVFDKVTGKLHFSRSPRYFEFDFSTDLSCIASLQNLRHVSIRGSFRWSNMHSFFDTLATYQGETLEDLRVDESYGFNDADLREVIRIRSLRILACNLSSVEDVEIEQLAQLPHLAVLIVESHQTGSLRNLLGNLASKECPTLEHLAVWGEILTPQEVTEVSAISSLKRLECVICSTDGLDDQGIIGLSEASHLEELTILGPETGSLKGLFRALSLRAPPNLKSLFLSDYCIDLEETRLLVQIDSITRLSCGFKDKESFSLLANMTNLESLQIISKHFLTNISRQLLDIFRGCRKLETIDLGRTYDLHHDFLIDALDILKSVRDPSTQCPLKIRINRKLNDVMIDIDETYLIVTKEWPKHIEDEGEEESEDES